MLESSPLHWEEHNHELPGYTVAVDSREDVRRIVPDLAAQGASMVKTFYHIELPLYRYLVEVAFQHALQVVHDPGGSLFHWVRLDRAIELGVTSIEHAQAPLSFVLRDDLRALHDAISPQAHARDEQRQVWDQVIEAGTGALSEERVRALAGQMVAREAFLCPTLYVYQETHAQERQAADDEGTDAEPDAEAVFRKRAVAFLYQVSGSLVGALAGHGVRMLVGTDCVTLFSEAVGKEMALLRRSGVSALEILRGATLYPARWLGVDDRIGSVEPGKRADLVILDANPIKEISRVAEVSMVIQRGKVVRV
jgi:hypothetical protein